MDWYHIICLFIVYFTIGGIFAGLHVRFDQTLEQERFHQIVTFWIVLWPVVVLILTWFIIFIIFIGPAFMLAAHIGKYPWTSMERAKHFYRNYNKTQAQIHSDYLEEWGFNEAAKTLRNFDIRNFDTYEV